jgi:sulfur oxidation c-type cytochrome SoxA
MGFASVVSNARAGLLLCARTGVPVLFAALALVLVPCLHPSPVAAQGVGAAPIAIDGDAAARPWRRYHDWPARDSAKFNTLTALVSPPAPAAPRKLAAPVAGDPAKGAKLVADRGRGGSCLACHVMGQAGAAPVETRDNLDDMVNPALWAVEDKAPALWTLPGPGGAACATCHGEPAQAFKTWAAGMPAWEPRLGKVLGVEEFVARHAKATTGHGWAMESDENTTLAVYLRFLANGSAIDVDTRSAPAKAAYARGAALSARKVGQLNFACVDCHGADRGAHKWIRGQWLALMRGALDHFPTWRTSQQAIWDIRKRFQWCQVAVWANELPPDATEYGDLELYLTAQSNGLKLSVPGIRQ